ncbi:unnamed protein product [Spirodela intermedia]|uniref:Uncharacterized protein n=1 Tax=Spirodela intermedia TaxID=51605 RepID=A0A7I8LCT2_SPIIN|nr:unnamed protein product [Spirodela intermedia]
MESLEADLEALKKDNSTTLMACLPNGPPPEQSQRQPEQHSLQNPEQRKSNYKPNCRTELPNFTSNNLDVWLLRAERFGPSHICRRNLNILIVQEEEQSQEEFQEEDWAPLKCRSQEEDTLFVAHHETMKLQEELSLSISKFHSYDHRRCHNIPLKIQDLLIIQDCLPLDLSSTSVVFEALLGLPPERIDDHAINLLPSTQLINLQPYKYTRFQKDEIEQLVHELCTADIIQPSKRWQLQFCIDYKALNKSTNLNRFPIPIVDELLEELHGMSIFSKLDLKPYQWKFILIFFDNILVYNKTHKEYDEHLDNVFLILAANSLYINEKKCQFKQSQLEYLSNWVSTKGVSTDQGKFSTIWDWSSPKNLKELQGFLRLITVYDCRIFFHKLKVAMTSTPKNVTIDALSRAPRLTEVVVAPMCIAQGVDVTTINKEGLPKSKGYDSILVIVDRLNKFGHFIPLRHTFTAKHCPNLCNGTLNKHQGTELKMSSSYHPKHMATSHHSVIKMTPFKAMYGWDPPTLTRYGSPMSPIDVVDTYLKERDDILQPLKKHLLAAQSKMKAQGFCLLSTHILGILTNALEWNVTPQDILAIQNSSFDTEVLVKWELASSLHKQFSDFYLEDKVKLMGESIDKAPRTSARRKKAQSPISQ